MKRAALLIHGPLNAVGGVERYNRYLLDLLIEEGYQVDLLEPSKLAVPGWVRRYLYPLVQYYYAGREVKSRQADYELIVTTGYTGGFLQGSHVLNICFGCVSAYFRSLKGSLPFNWKFFLGNYFIIFLDRLSKKGKLCVAISPQVQEELRYEYGKETVMIPCGIDTRHFTYRAEGKAWRERLAIPQEAVCGLFAGRWAEIHKGLDILVPFMKERKDITWLIVPDGPIPFEKLPHIRILEGVTYEDLPAVYSMADFSIQLSRYESFGFSFLESLSCAVPALSTPVGIAPYLYRESPFRGLLISYEHGHPKKMTAEVSRILNQFKDKAYARRLGLKARQMVENEFGLERWKSQMRAVVESVGRKETCKL